MGVQASLPPDLVPIGATTLLFVISASCAVFLAVGQAVFQDRLLSNLSQVVPAHVTNAVISVGATSVRLVVSTQDLASVLRAYSDAVTQVFVCILIYSMKLTANFHLVYSCSSTCYLLPLGMWYQVDFHQKARVKEASGESR